MFHDGLWLSGMTLIIKRDNTPVPDQTKKDITINLSRTQINAILSLFGIGMENGDLLMYDDENLDKIIAHEDELFTSEYKLVSRGMKSSRRSIHLFKPFVENKALCNANWEDTMISSSTEGFLTIDDEDSDSTQEIEAFDEESLEDLHIQRMIHGSS